jgi:UrcA family protein
MTSKMHSKANKSVAFVVAALSLVPAMALASDPMENGSVSVKVSLTGLDLNSPAGAEKLVRRISIAAEQACGAEAKYDPLRTAMFDHCHRDRVAEAVRAISRPLVTQAYIASFPREAAMYNIGDQQHVVAAK